VGAIAEVETAIHVYAGLRERFNLCDEGRRIDDDAGANHRLLLGAQNSARDELQYEAIFADDYGVPGVVSAGDAGDVVKGAGEIVDDFAFAFVTPLRADHHN
jgi:hypothetical protein